MANYPTNIILPINAVIIELTDDTPTNTASNSDGKWGGGYVRQVGLNVFDWNVDDFVQYDASQGVTFSQGSATFLFIYQQYIYFVQQPIL